MVRRAHGLYESGYRSFKIVFPYRTEHFMYFGAESDARRTANRVQKKIKWPYAPKIKELKL